MRIVGLWMCLVRTLRVCGEGVWVMGSGDCE